MHPFLLFAAAAFPQEIGNHAWHLFHVPEDGAYGLYVDTASVEAEGSARTAWIKNDRLSVDEHGIIRRVERTRFDCDAATATLLAAYEYGASGELSDMFEIPPERLQAQPVRPGSPGEASLRYLCGEGPATAVARAEE